MVWLATWDHLKFDISNQNTRYSKALRRITKGSPSWPRRAWVMCARRRGPRRLRTRSLSRRRQPHRRSLPNASSLSSRYRLHLASRDSATEQVQNLTIYQMNRFFTSEILGVNVFLYERSPLRGQVLSPWAIKKANRVAKIARENGFLSILTPFQIKFDRLEHQTNIV